MLALATVKGEINNIFEQQSILKPTIYKLCKSIKEFRQIKGVPEQQTLVSIPLFRSWRKIICHICLSRSPSYGKADFGKAWRQKNPKKLFLKCLTVR
jgi:hypothetical protein